MASKLSQMQQEHFVNVDNHDLEVRDAGDDQIKLSGYVVKYDTPADRGEFIEFVKPSAFTKTLQERQDVRALYQHDMGQLLGRTRSSTLELKNTDIGLGFDLLLPKHRVDIAELVRRGDLYGMSFGFQPEKVEYVEGPGDELHRLLFEVRLIEISIVTDPAYGDNTSVALRNAGVFYEKNIENMLELRSAAGILSDEAAPIALPLRKF